MTRSTQGSDFLACDWGTTNVRAWVISAAGEIIRRQTFPFGVAKLKPGEAASLFSRTVRPALMAQSLSAMLCGMIGSDLGWVSVPYRNCPADFHSVAHGLHQVESEPAAWIVPGLQSSGTFGAPDVMRGEETQILGWLANQAVQKEPRILCHPGTHTKWVLVEGERIMRFVTAMTGELFDVLRKHSVLRTEADANDAGAFAQGVAAAGDGSAVAARLFTARTRVVAGGMPRESTASYLSGLLIGAEIASVPALLSRSPVPEIDLLGERALCESYAAALTHAGISSCIHDGEAAVIAGLSVLKGMVA